MGILSLALVSCVKSVIPAGFWLTDVLGPICTFASRMQHMEDREDIGSDGRKTSDSNSCPDVEVSELAQHLGIATCPPSSSVMLTNLIVNERSQRDCAGLLPDQLVVIPPQKESISSVTDAPG